jgi:hypothetical protein
VRRMIECTNSLGHSLRGSLDRPGLVCGEVAGDGIEWDDGDLMARSGWRGGELTGERGRGRRNGTAAKLTGGVHEG